MSTLHNGCHGFKRKAKYLNVFLLSNFMEESEKSEINTGIAIAFRLNELWAKTNLAYQTAQWAKLNSILDTIYFELSDDLKKEDEEKYRKINIWVAETNLSPYFLQKKWTFMKNLQKGQGMGKKYVDEARTSIV